jgi:hypothetical protein
MPAIQKRIPLKQAHVRRLTTSPDARPPHLLCPECAGALTYRHSYVGGINVHCAEQWDYYRCACGIFQYRHRTRRLKKLDSAEARALFTSV